MEGKLDWVRFARNLFYGVMVTMLLVMVIAATVAAGMTMVISMVTNGEIGNVKSHEKAKRDVPQGSN